MYNLCCIANELKPRHRIMSMTWRRYTEIGNAFDILAERWLNNVNTTYHIIEHCFKNGWGYRVSSSLFPVLTHPEFPHQVQDAPNWEQIKQTFDKIRSANQNWGVRLSTHPDQFNVLASDNEQAVFKSIKELNIHGWLMDQLGCDRSYQNPINIHINCSKGEHSQIAAKFMENLHKCDESVTSRLVIENEDKGIWNTSSLLEHFEPYGIPITFDNLHNKCNPSYFLRGNELAEKEIMELCAQTWHGIKPIFHYSESDISSKNPRSHASLPTNRPIEFNCDWDIELKDKELAIRKLLVI